MAAVFFCKCCVLQDSFPGITFDDDGRCSYCKKCNGGTPQEDLKSRFLTKFQSIITKGNPEEKRYDAIVAFSGGKDSTYTLKILKEIFKLKLLAVTFDHGLMSPLALRNINRVTGALQIDHQMIRPAEAPLYRLFRKSISEHLYPIKSLMRASAICNTCMNLVKSYLLKTAIEMRVPMVAYGWSPGQAAIISSVFKLNSGILRQMQRAAVTPFTTEDLEPLSSFFIQEHHLRAEKLPTIVHPLAFLPYDENKILNDITTLGWEKPKDTDANSTNCLLNGFANAMHIKQYGFHPYSLEISGLVRHGHMSREEGLKKLSENPDPDIMAYVRGRIFSTTPSIDATGGRYNDAP